MSENKIPRSLPIAPMIPWFIERVEKETAEVFSQRVGVSDRRIREAIAGRSQMMSFENVDRIITNDGTVNFIDFYPEYDDDESFFALSNAKFETVTKNPCTVENCNRPIHAKGLCQPHYRKVYYRNKKASLAT